MEIEYEMVIVDTRSHSFHWVRSVMNRWMESHWLKRHYLSRRMRWTLSVRNSKRLRGSEWKRRGMGNEIKDQFNDSRHFEVVSRWKRVTRGLSEKYLSHFLKVFSFLNGVDQRSISCSDTKRQWFDWRRRINFWMIYWRRGNNCTRQWSIQHRNDIRRIFPLQEDRSHSLAFSREFLPFHANHSLFIFLFSFYCFSPPLLSLLVNSLQSLWRFPSYSCWNFSFVLYTSIHYLGSFIC